MGFTTLSTIGAVAGVAAKTVEAVGQHKQSKAYNAAARATEQMAQNRAGAIVNTAMKNQILEQRNANDELAFARADAAASGLVADGSVTRRESDLATRLQQEIRSHTTTALNEANDIRRQGALDAWNLRQQSRNARLSTVGSLLGAAGSVFQGVGNIRAANSFGGSGNNGARA